MKVAVIIPVRNGAPGIGRTVRALQAQTRPADEVIVVDNGSTDDTAAVAEAAGARVVHEATPGSYAARNAGVAATDAEILAFTDGDCEPEPTWLERLLAGFSPGVDVVGGEVVAPSVVTPTERWCSARTVLSQANALTHPFRPFFATANVAWRRAALERIGGFEWRLASGGDVDAHWRLQRAGGTLAFAPDAVVVHPYRAQVRALLDQQHRYGIGHGRLDRRWGAEPGYAEAAGSAPARLRALWLLAFRLPWRLVTRRDVAIPLIDAAVVTVREAGRFRGRRVDPLPALAPPPATMSDPAHPPAVS